MELVHLILGPYGRVSRMLHAHYAPGEIAHALRGRELTAAHRQGKSMWCETSGQGRSRTPGPTLGIRLGSVKAAAMPITLATPAIIIAVT